MPDASRLTNCDITTVIAKGLDEVNNAAWLITRVIIPFGSSLGSRLTRFPKRSVEKDGWLIFQVVGTKLLSIKFNKFIFDLFILYRKNSYKQLLQGVLKASRASNTVLKYERCFAAWQAWCTENKVSALPANTEDIARFFMEQFTNKAPFSRIEGIFYSIKWHHDCDPTVAVNPCDKKFLRLTLEGLKRIAAKPVCKKEPITTEILGKIVAKFGSSNNLMNIRLCTMCLLSFAGFLRNDELINIRECDLDIHPSFIRIFLTKSKTDQLKIGSWVYIAKIGSHLCPVTMLLKYITMAQITEFSEKFLIRPVVYAQSIQAYRLRNGQLSYSRCREIFKNALKEVGVDPTKFGLHSLRSGGATAAASLGVPDRLFKKHGRWLSDHSKDGYVNESVKTQLSVSLSLGL